MLDDKTQKWFERLGLKPPEHIGHDLTPDDIAAKVTRVTTSNWRLEGNKLIADTEHGPLVNYLPTDVICRGTDDRGLPILTKIEV